MLTFITGLILFVGIHSVSIVGPSFRDRVVERIGLRPWQGLFALASISGLVLLVSGYSDLRGQTAILYLLPRWVHVISSTLMIPVFPLLLAAYLPGGIKATVRHPMLVAVKLWAFAHLLANGALADVMLFGTILAWAVAVRISLKRRPIRAIATAPAGQWNDVIAVIGGLVIYGMMLNFGHALLIGMPLILR
jgi:uncharacterized membrane protein